MRTFPFVELRTTDTELRRLHRQYRLAPKDSSRLRHAEVARLLAELAHRSQSDGGGAGLRVRAVGESFEGRTLRLASIGNGPRSVLMWSQMHGDESTHTSVVLDLLSLLVGSRGAAMADCDLLERCTLHVLPMLNPDGAERQTRRNAQQIDINRDAVDLATPEGRALRDVVNELRPQFGFNLHNQRADKQVGDTGRVAVVSVLAPPLDEAGSVTPGLIRARQLALEMFAASERLLPGHATRYEAGYMATAFGEWVQSRGTTTALLEAGGWPPGEEPWLVELHFVVLLSALRAIADDRLDAVNSARYASLPLNGGA